VEGHQDLKLKGIKLLSMYAGFYPNDRKLDHLWEYATRHSLPDRFHRLAAKLWDVLVSGVANL
jgi:predicted TIM-barrel fold metal-dependent hydrolase